MKTRDSGMPAEDHWSTFFAPEALLARLGLDRARGPIVDVGCGYGTFTLPIARLTGQAVIGLDIEADLIERLEERARRDGLARVRGFVRDVAANGIGEADGSADIVLLFNLLHCEDPLGLLREARRVLMPGGRVGIIHWRSDIVTPRGPAAAIRPRPEAVATWLAQTGFALAVPATVLEPYHYGLVGKNG